MAWLHSELIKYPGKATFSFFLVGGDKKTVRIDYPKYGIDISVKEAHTLLETASNIIDFDIVREKPELEALMALTESEIERSYLRAAYPKFDFIQPQLVIGAYRVDFAIPDQRIAIELDGHEFHSSREQRTKDAKRERDLEMMGWRVIRFTGTEVTRNVESCVDETLRLISSFGGAK